MPNLDELEQIVSDLSKNESTPFEFRDCYTELEAAALTATNAEVIRLSDILSSFRGKLPDLIILKPIRAKARDLADDLMLSTLHDRIGRINARNEALASLSGKLDVQIEKANSDAELLTRIRDGAEKATKTVAELKGLVDDLNATDASTKTQLLAIIDRIGNISSIFDPEDA